MMILALILAIAPQQEAPPQQRAQKPTPLTPPPTWLTPKDYPKEAKGAEGDVTFKLNVDANGVVIGCTIVASSGSQALDDQSCRVASQRARFNPARDSSGNAIPFTWTTTFGWERY